MDNVREHLRKLVAAREERERRWEAGEYPQAAYDAVAQVLRDVPEPARLPGERELNAETWKRHVELTARDQWTDPPAPDFVEHLRETIKASAENITSGLPLLGIERLSAQARKIATAQYADPFDGMQGQLRDMERQLKKMPRAARVSKAVPDPMLRAMRQQRESQERQTDLLEAMVGHLAKQEEHLANQERTGRTNAQVALVGTIAAVIAATTLKVPWWLVLVLLVLGALYLLGRKQRQSP